MPVEADLEKFPDAGSTPAISTINNLYKGGIFSPLIYSFRLYYLKQKRTISTGDSSLFI